MQAFATLAALLVAFYGSPAQSGQATVRLKIGDKISVVVFGYPDYSRQYQVLNDGTITGIGFDHLLAKGKTLDQFKEDLRKAFLKTIRDPQISIVLDEPRNQLVYITSSTGQSIGPLTYTPDLTLAKVITLVTVPDRKEDFVVHVYREGKPILRIPFNDLVGGSDPAADIPLKPDDFITVLDRPNIKVWVAGAVTKPGEYRVVETTTAQQLLIQAGDVLDGLKFTDEYKVYVQRGPNKFAVDPSPTGKGTPLEFGDTLYVQGPEYVDYSIGGEVKTPADRRSKAGTTLLQAIETSGGISLLGTYSDVLVFRKGGVHIVDAGKIYQEGKMVDFVVENGDMIWVQQSQRKVTVLGFVKNPGLQLMRDGVNLSLADAVSQAGGTDEKGTYHRVYLGRKQPDGTVKVTEYQLDAYLKDGDMKQNPPLQAGDVIMVGQPKGITVSGVSQVISDLLFIQSVVRR